MSRVKDRVWPFRLDGRLTGTREEIIADQITAKKVAGTTKLAIAARLRMD